MIALLINSLLSCKSKEHRIIYNPKSCTRKENLTLNDINEVQESLEKIIIFPRNVKIQIKKECIVNFRKHVKKITNMKRKKISYRSFVEITNSIKSDLRKSIKVFYESFFVNRMYTRINNHSLYRHKIFKNHKTASLEEKCICGEKCKSFFTSYKNTSFNELLQISIKIQKLTILLKKSKNQQKHFVVESIKFKKKKRSGKKISYQIMNIKDKQYYYLKQKSTVNISNWKTIWLFKIYIKEYFKKSRSKINRTGPKGYKLKINSTVIACGNIQKNLSSFSNEVKIGVQLLFQVQKTKKYTFVHETKRKNKKSKTYSIRRKLMQLKILSNKLLETSFTTSRKYFLLKQIRELPQKINKIKKKISLTKKNYLATMKDHKNELSNRFKKSNKNFIKMRFCIDNHQKMFVRLPIILEENINLAAETFHNTKYFSDLEHCNSTRDAETRFWLCARQKSTRRLIPQLILLSSNLNS